MNFQIIKLISLTILLSSFTNNVLAIEHEIFGTKDARSLVCTSGAKEYRLKEMLAAKECPVISLNLEKASNLTNVVSLFQEPLPNLHHLKLKFGVDDILKILPKKTPNLRILDLSNTNLLDVTLLSGLNLIPSLQVIDISNIPFQTEILGIIEQLLENPNLTIYIDSFKKMYPHQQQADLSIYKDNPKIVLGTTYATSIKSSTAWTSSNIYIY